MSSHFAMLHFWIDRNKEPDWALGLDAVKRWPPSKVDLEEEFPGLSEEDARQVLAEDVRSLQELYQDSHSEGAVIELDRKKILITGGLSNGDSPTDLFDSMMRLIKTRIASRIGFKY
jgi:hypothetical protein